MDGCRSKRLTLCQECRRAAFWARYCSSCTLRSLFPLWKIRSSVMLMTPLCCVRSGVTSCWLFIVLYLCRMCQCGLHTVFRSNIGILIRLFAVEPCSTAGPLFPSQCFGGTIVLTMYSMVWDWRVSRAEPMLFHWPKLLYPFSSSTIFPVLVFLSIGWYCVAGVFGLIGCRSLSQPCAAYTCLIIIIIIVDFH